MNVTNALQNRTTSSLLTSKATVSNGAQANLDFSRGIAIQEHQHQQLPYPQEHSTLVEAPKQHRYSLDNSDSQTARQDNVQLLNSLARPESERRQSMTDGSLHHPELSSSTSVPAYNAVSAPSSSSQTFTSHGGTRSRPSSTALDLPPLRTPTYIDLQRPSSIGEKPSKRPIEWIARSRTSESAQKKGAAQGASGQSSDPTPSTQPVRARLSAAETSSKQAEDSSNGADITNQQMRALREYSLAPNSSRQAVIDEMICQHLKDDAFVTLCEDVENAWRRIGFEDRR